MRVNCHHCSLASLRIAIALALFSGILMLESADCMVWRMGPAGAAVTESVAQGYGPSRSAPRRDSKVRTRKPSVSPYLNLLRNGNGISPPGVDYFTQVRPQFQQQRVNAQQRTALRNLEEETTSLGRTVRTPMPTTGRGATYGNYLHFYPSLSSGR